MAGSRQPDGRARYGVDAPYVPIILLAVGAVFLVGAGSGAAVWWNGTFGVLFVAQALIYLHATLRGKHVAWARLLDGLHLVGDEEVLDLGCGRGAVLLAVAGRLTTGRAHGVDLWRSADQSGNGPDATRANAVALHVADRIDLDTGDITALPYPGDSFDLVVSSLAIHNIPTAQGRLRALDEAMRVLRPGGRLVIADIRGVGRYAGHLRDLGARDVRVRGLGPGFWYGGPWTATRVVTAVRPGL